MQCKWISTHSGRRVTHPPVKSGYPIIHTFCFAEALVYSTLYITIRPDNKHIFLVNILLTWSLPEELGSDFMFCFYGVYVQLGLLFTHCFSFIDTICFSLQVAMPLTCTLEGLVWIKATTLFSPKCFCPSRWIPGQCLILSSCFPLNPFQIIIHYHLIIKTMVIFTNEWTISLVHVYFQITI